MSPNLGRASSVPVDQWDLEVAVDSDRIDSRLVDLGKLDRVEVAEVVQSRLLAHEPVPDLMPVAGHHRRQVIVPPVEQLWGCSTGTTGRHLAA